MSPKSWLQAGRDAESAIKRSLRSTSMAQVAPVSSILANTFEVEPARDTPPVKE